MKAVEAAGLRVEGLELRKDGTFVVRTTKTPQEQTVDDAKDAADVVGERLR
jgi:hypothetical protein